MLAPQDTSKRLDRKRHIDYLVARGLSALWKLTNTPLRTVRRRIIRTYFTSRHKGSIMEALEWATSRDEQHRGDEMHSLFSPRYGWLHTCETMESWSLNARCNYDLRSQGYAFWDRARIKGLQQFRDPRARVEGMATDKFPAGHRSHSDGCKIAVEFAGVAIRKDAIRQFADEVDEKDSAADDGSDDADEDDKEEEEDTPYVISWRDDM